MGEDPSQVARLALRTRKQPDAATDADVTLPMAVAVMTEATTTATEDPTHPAADAAMVTAEAEAEPRGDKEVPYVEPLAV